MAGKAPQEVCRAYRRTGRCKFAKACKFSHGDENEGDENAGSSTKKSRNEKDRYKIPDSVQTLLESWRRDVPIRIHGAIAPLGTRLASFLGQAFVLIDSDFGAMQEVIERLASDGGLKRIDEVAQRARRDQDKTTVFSDEIMILFHILRHPNVIQSPSMEGKLANIYQYLCGFDGSRCEAIFSCACQHLERSSETQIPNALASLHVFATLLAASTNAKLQPTVQATGRGLVATGSTLLANMDGAQRFQALRSLQAVDRTLELGTALPESERSKPVSGAYNRPNFLVHQNPPGTRHGNDFLDFCEVQIMPTMEEIRSVANEYIPSTDPDSWIPDDHIDGLLDRLFRTLREDSVGQLRDTVREILEEQPRNPGSKTQLARTNVYYCVEIESVDVSKGRQGMEFSASFDEPHALASKLEGERDQWWTASKRLKKENLVCLVDTKGGGATLFCCVAQDVARAKQSEAEDTPGRACWPSHC